MTTPAILIAGPTASGKSALALALAERTGGVIVNADSMQVYAELRVLTARPGPEEERRAPHRLYGFQPAAEACSVGRWLAAATTEIAAARAQGRAPILVGGTGLYFQALTGGLARIPDIPDTIRENARSLHAALGGEAFRERLRALDPETAGRLRASDSQRLVRAWEVVTATGRPLAGWQREPALPALSPPWHGVVLERPREALYAACDARFEAMLREGALDEVRALLALGLDPALPAMKAVGVRELAAHLSGRSVLDEATAAAQQATRNFAKRQLTWFRNKMRSWEWLCAQQTERNLERIISFMS